MLDLTNINFILILFEGLIFHKQFAAKKKFPLVLICVQLVLLLGMRNISVGADSRTYNSLFQYVVNGASISYLEKGNQLIFWLVAKLWPNTTVLFLIYASITVIPIAYVAYKESDNVWFSMMIYAGFMYYYWAFNAMRQAAAMSIAMLAIYNLRNKKCLCFLMLSAISVLFHSSAVVIFLCYFIKDMCTMLSVCRSLSYKKLSEACGGKSQKIGRSVCTKMFEVQDIEYDYILQYNLMQTAVERFNETEKFLLENDLNERCLYGPLAVHLRDVMQEEGIRDYVVDTEYNRGMNGRNYGIKQIDGADVSLDLIVHKRGYDEVFGYRNLLCAEMKKSSNPKGYSSDLIRLQKLTDQEHGFGYKMGFMLWVDQKQKVLQIQKTYVDGKEWSPFDKRVL